MVIIVITLLLTILYFLLFNNKIYINYVQFMICFSDQK